MTRIATSKSTAAFLPVLESAQSRSRGRQGQAGVTTIVVEATASYPNSSQAK